MGVLMMVGMVVANSILIVEFTHRLRGRRYAAPRRASSLVPHPPAADSDDLARATVFGLIPMAFKLGTGSEAYAAACARHHRRAAVLGRPDRVRRSRRLSARRIARRRV
jgi:multidrug efflux pump subunit AcrB